MIAIDSTIRTLQGVLPCVPSFSFLDPPEIHRPVPESVYRALAQSYMRPFKSDPMFDRATYELALFMWHRDRPWWLI